MTVFLTKYMYVMTGISNENGKPSTKKGRAS